MKNQEIKKTLFIICSLWLAFSFTASAQTDLRIKKKSWMNIMSAAMKDPRTGKKLDIGKLPESTMFIKGARILTEMRTEKDDKRIFTRGIVNAIWNAN